MRDGASLSRSWRSSSIRGGRIVGCTIGNDMSSRDIEGENLLYLPQAKVYDRSCALGPWILLGVTEADAREWTVRSTIIRNGAPVFSGETRLGNIKRTLRRARGILVPVAVVSSRRGVADGHGDRAAR